MAAERRKSSRPNHHKRRRRTSVGGGIGARLLIMLAVVAAVLLSIVIFFRVQKLEVKGNSVYDTQTVIGASGLETGDHLLFNKSTVAGRIKAALPYVEQVRIARILPDTVVLEIKESAAVFAVKADTGETWLMSFSGKLLEPVNGAEVKNHPAMEGFTLKAPASGEQAHSEDTESFQAAQTVLAALDGSGLADKITRVDVTRSFDIVLQYEDRFQVKLGGTDQMDYKIQYLAAVLEQLSQYQTGTIDLTFEEEKVARFIPG